MCDVSDIVMIVKFLDKSEVYSIRPIQEIKDTYSREDYEHILETKKTDEFYITEDGMYKLCLDDEQLMSFVNGEGLSGGAIFADSTREPLEYLSKLLNVKELVTYAE